MVIREIYSVGLKCKVDAEVQEIISTPSRGGGFRYQVVGVFTDEDGKEHKCQSLIGKVDAQTVAAALGQSLPTTESELKEAEVVESFAAEEVELLVPEPSTSPLGDGRVLGQHTGGQIVSATDASQSLPAHDYIFIGRAESQGPDMEALEEGIEAGEEESMAVYGKGNNKVSSVYARGASRTKCGGCGQFPCVSKNAETCDAEFSDIVPSVKNVWDDGIPDADGEETFVVETDLKDYLIEEFYEETFQGFFSVVRHDSGADLWEVTFPQFMSEDVIDAIAEYQEVGMSDREMDEELADWVRAEEFNARGLTDSDDLFDESSTGISKSTAAIATAVLALGAAYWWSQRK